MEAMTLIQQLRGRAAFLRDKGRVKSPGLMEQAANALEAHLDQPVQAVDAGAIREVIVRLNEIVEMADCDPDEFYSFDLDEQADKLTRALSGEKAGPVGDGLVLVGYCHRDDAERLMDRKEQSHHTFTAVEVWNKRSDFYRTPVHITLPASPTPDKEVKG